jgi:hypothetical protein
VFVGATERAVKGEGKIHPQVHSAVNMKLKVLLRYVAV